VLPWIDTPDEALAEFARVLEPGGHLIASTNNRTPLHALADPVRLPILAPLRDGVRQMASAVRPDGRPPRARPIGFARPAEFAGQLAANGFSLIRGQGFGFGPFTILGQQLLQDRLGNRLERELQQRVERGYRRLEGVAAQYLILARTSGARRADPSVNLVR